MAHKCFMVENLRCKVIKVEEGIWLHGKIMGNFEKIPEHGKCEDGKITIKGGEISEEKICKILAKIKKHAELEKLSFVQCSTDDNNPKVMGQKPVIIETLVIKLLDVKGKGQWVFKLLHLKRNGLETLPKIVAAFDVLKQFDIDEEWKVTLAGDMYDEEIFNKCWAKLGGNVKLEGWKAFNTKQGKEEKVRWKAFNGLLRGRC